MDQEQKRAKQEDGIGGLTQQRTTIRCREGNRRIVLREWTIEEYT